MQQLLTPGTEGETGKEQQRNQLIELDREVKRLEPEPPATISRQTASPN